MKLNAKGSGLPFALLFTGIWSFVTLIFDAFVLVSLANQVAASNFHETTGVVTASEVSRSTDSDGDTTYGADITYTYRVEEEVYTSDRYAYGQMSTSSRSHAESIVAAHPVGTPVTVFYNPADHAEATLRQGVENSSLFLLIFLTPFNLVMLGGWTAVARLLFSRGRERACAGFLRSDDGVRAVVRFTVLPDIAAAGIAMLATSFASIFVVGFIAGFAPSKPLILATFVAIAGSGVAAYVWRKWRVMSGRSTLEVDRLNQRVRLPRRKRREAYAVALENEVPFADIAEIRTPVDHNRKTNNRSTHQLHLVLATPGIAEPVVLAKWLSETNAAAAAEWLRVELGLPAPATALQPELLTTTR